MAWSLDARIPVTLVTDPAELKAALAAGAPAAVLAEAPAPELPPGTTLASFTPAAEGPHSAACSCCAGRSPAAAALDQLFQGRVRGKYPWFDRVLALASTAKGHEEIQTALTEDALTSGRYRGGAAPAPPPG
jgi:hypothetical protein